MIGLYVGCVMFSLGVVISLILTCNMKVSMNANFDIGELPLIIKIGIVFVIVGVIVVASSTMYMIIADPLRYLG